MPRSREKLPPFLERAITRFASAQFEYGEWRKEDERFAALPRDAILLT